MSRNNSVRRLAAACAFVAGVAAAPTVSAQAYPSKNVEFIVHVNPGGGTDVFARLIQEIITREKLISQPMVVASKTGGAGTVAFNYVKGKRGDPHSVLTIATGRGFGMPAGVPKEAVAAMEGILKKAHQSGLWRDYSKKNMYEDRWMGSADFTRYLDEQRVAQKDFIDSIGLSKK